MTTAKAPTIDYGIFSVSDLLAHRKTIDDVLGKHRSDIAKSLADLEDALGERDSPTPFRKGKRAASAKAPKARKGAKKGKGGGTGGKGQIRWATKFNSFLADAIERSGGGMTKAEIDAAAVKGKMMKEGTTNAYMATRRLIAAGGLAKKGDKIVKGKNFRAAE